MKEIELKFKVEEDYGVFKSKIEKTGVKYRGKYQQTDIWLDTKDGRLRQERKGLRIRQQNGKATLTLKSKQVYGKFREAEELEVVIDDFKKTFGIFGELGFEIYIKIKKEREIWKLGDIEVCLDKVEDLGVFLELEGSKKGIEEAIKRLGLKTSARITKHYGELYKERNGKSK